MTPKKLPSCEFDLTRFAYVLKSRMDDLALSYTQICALTGCSRRQVSYALNGKPVCAGATWMLAKLAQIDLAEMLPTPTRERLFHIRKIQQKHAVTPLVTREMEGAEG